MFLSLPKALDNHQKQRGCQVRSFLLLLLFGVRFLVSLSSFLFVILVLAVVVIVVVSVFPWDL